MRRRKHRTQRRFAEPPTKWVDSIFVPISIAGFLLAMSMILGLWILSKDSSSPQVLPYSSAGPQLEFPNQPHLESEPQAKGGIVIEK